MGIHGLLGDSFTLQDCLCLSLTSPPSVSRLFGECGCIDVSQADGHPRPVGGVASPFLLQSLVCHSEDDYVTVTPVIEQQIILNTNEARDSNGTAPMQISTKIVQYLKLH
jgi:hypothetical protein